MLKELLENEMQKSNLSLRAVSKQTKVAHTTIQRVLNGNPADLATTKSICNWLGVSVSTVLNVFQEPTVENQVALIIEAQPALRELFEQAITDVKKGDLSPDDLADVLSYAAYRLDLGRKNNGAKKERNKPK